MAKIDTQEIASTFESDAAIRRREANRSSLSQRLGRLLERLHREAPHERIGWYADCRGGAFSLSPAKSPAGPTRSIATRRVGVPRLSRRPTYCLQHEFDILGSGRKALGPEIDWQLDFKSGFRWRDDANYPIWSWRKVEEVPGEEIYKGPFYSLEDRSDLKMPWDLSSMFHLPVLGEAFLQSGQARYADEVFDQLEEWQRRNPYRARRQLDLCHGGRPFAWPT